MYASLDKTFRAASKDRGRLFTNNTTTTIQHDILEALTNARFCFAERGKTRTNLPQKGAPFFCVERD